MVRWGSDGLRHALLPGVASGDLILTAALREPSDPAGRVPGGLPADRRRLHRVPYLHLATLSACWRLAEDRDPVGDLDVAAYWCAEHAPRAVRICHHLHGGLGMDVTYPLPRFSSLTGDLVRFLGGAGYRLERLACTST